jgi:hypothetical protein
MGTREGGVRDWDQTKHNVGGNQPGTNEHVGNTVKQAA